MHMTNDEAVTKADNLLELLIKNQSNLFGSPAPNDSTGRFVGEAICALRLALIEGLKLQP